MMNMQPAANETMDLREYDFVVINSSAGKDSQAMLDYVVQLAREQGVVDRLLVVHSDLGRSEWKGTRELAERQAKHYGLPFHVVQRSQDLLDHVEQKGMLPSSTTRYCTSDHKRDQIVKVVRKLKTVGRAARVLNCMGLRAQESRKRASMVALERNKRASCRTREVFNWLPIHTWTVEQVWERIRQSGVEHHPAYDLGMPRLSCVFCIFSPKAALLLAGKHNPELLAEYVAVETKIGHTFKNGFAIATIQQELAAGAQPGPIQDWTM
jgi:3'-phosphoadenosine 5'-phosphosulfate sulfotransferase (PAPS reductase)/FAD synthetase